MLQTISKMTVLALLAVTLVIPTASASDWAQWRGPNFNGTTDAKNVPTDISSPSAIQWSLDLHGESSATPAVIGNRIFLTSNNEDKTELYGICVDLESGKELWNKKLSASPGPIPRNSLTSPSPIADEERVYFTFGSGLIVAMDHDGNEVWSLSLEKFGNSYLQFSYSSSPTLLNGRLYFPIMTGQWKSDASMKDYTDEDSCLLCLDAKTGELIFREHRSSDAVGESFDAYTTAIPYAVDGKTQLVLQGGDYTTGHDADTGKELWRFADNPRKLSNWRLIPSPVVMGEMIFNSQPRGGMAYAFNPKDSAQKDLETAGWTFDERATDVPTPAYYNGKLYMLNGVQRSMTVFNPETGEVLQVADIEDNRRFWSSPSIAGGHIYLVDEMGSVVVLNADSLEVVSRADLDGRPCKSTPVPLEGKLLIRTGEALVCLGN